MNEEGDGPTSIMEYVRKNTEEISDNTEQIKRVESRMSSWIQSVEENTRFNTRILFGILITTTGSLITGIISLLEQL